MNEKCFYCGGSDAVHVGLCAECVTAHAAHACESRAGACDACNALAVAVVTGGE